MENISKILLKEETSQLRRTLIFSKKLHLENGFKFKQYEKYFKSKNVIKRPLELPNTELKAR